jgi:insertion element IS1 protein InsB
VAQGKGGDLPKRKDTLLVPQPDDSVELDEVWSFVRRKGQQAWVWLAVSYQSRQVLAMVVGDRSAKTCRKLWERLPEPYQRLTSYTDFYRAYQQVIPREIHQACKKGSGLTNTVERFNLTLRQRVGRLVRKTLSFSKSPLMHLLCLRLFIDGYNRYCLKRFKKDIADPRMLTTLTTP